MKVLLLSTAECTGGGAIAAKRLLGALRAEGVDVGMLVRDRQTSDPLVTAVGSKWPKVMERLRLMWRLRLPLSRTWPYDLMSDGVDILSTKEYREADVIHLHWVNQGLLSLDQLREMVTSGKKILWTLHDEWPYLGLEHYRDQVPSEVTPFLNRMGIPSKKIHFIGCSEWITERARKAMPEARVTHINNCIPQELFRPIPRAEARRTLNLNLDLNQKVVLFCAQNVRDGRKGFRYLEEALKLLPHVRPVVIGRGGLSLPPDKMPLAYAAADVFVTPSLGDNLPNTVAEALSCGTPCVAFAVGGIPEMIEHGKTGYLARPRSSEDLAEGIRNVLAHPEYNEEAALSARRLFSPEKVAKAHLELYRM
jgi:glycosyltransferase involved in cell wall biosynthesis